MNAPVSVYEATEWREAAPGGGSRPQVFRLASEEFVIVKFPENPQGEIVLANEFLCCQLAEVFNLPINRARLVSVDERLLRLPRQNNQMPADFSAGIRCGLLRFERSEGAQPVDIAVQCSNSADLHHIAVFERLVCRGDGRQLLMYTPEGEPKKKFAAYDYGFAFGGTPNWSAGTLGALAQPVLPPNDPFTGQPYADGAALAGFVPGLRDLTSEKLTETFMKLDPPRWGIKLEDVQALVPVIKERAHLIVKQFDERYQQQPEML